MPTHRLASAALKSLSVDAELSPLVRRSFSVVAKDGLLVGGPVNEASSRDPIHPNGDSTGFVQRNNDAIALLCVEYRATTNRMLRVAVNGFMESLGVVLGVMEELDVDVLAMEN